MTMPTRSQIRRFALLLSLAGLLGVALLGVAASAARSAGPPLVTGPQHKGFGVTLAGNTREVVLTFTNNSTQYLEYGGSGISGGGGAFQFPYQTGDCVFPPDPGIAPGDTCTLTLDFTPPAAGKYEATFDVSWRPYGGGSDVWTTTTVLMGIGR